MEEVGKWGFLQANTSENISAKTSENLNKDGALALYNNNSNQ